ncbi:MAG TPA: fumarylacetoacetate hydrolase family protein [Vicinamibacterales bacterium]|nr:fumarylacetoacetate hydrolase family protein [Vicinamibacterales bacterium]
MTRARVWHDGRLVAAVLEGDRLVLAGGARVPAATARYAAPIQPRQIIATHLTYRSRCVEYKMAAPPQYPSYFMKPLGTVSAHGAPVARPRGCQFLNYEGELAVVIDRTCTNVPIAHALDYVKGYTIANDFGVHDFRHADRGAMFRVKGQDGFCPLGPVLVDAADLDPADVWLRTYVNGALVQEAHTGTDLLFSVAYQIADISRLVTLAEDDVLLTGTPANSRPVAPGDVVAVAISGIGRLENPVVELDRELVAVGDPPRVTEQTLHVALAIPEADARDRIASGDVMPPAGEHR